MSEIDKYVSSLLQEKNQNKYSSGAIKKNKYPAIVVQDEDPLEQNRIKARIVILDENGRKFGGVDRDKKDEEIPFAIPSTTSFIHSRPLNGEMVFISFENPDDFSSTRYWTGPIITSKQKFKFQSFEDAYKIFENTEFNKNQLLKSRPESPQSLPKKSDVALMGRDDAWAILKPREVYLAAGLFNRNSLEANTTTPSYFFLRQTEKDENENLKKYSVAELVSTIVNIYSPNGSFRDGNISKFELNDRVKEFPEISQKLHPTVFGDELIKFLDLFVRAFLRHSHTPQKNPIEIPEIKELQTYVVNGELQKLISSFVRIN